MSVQKVRYMMTNKDGTKDQVYPITHVDAVNGLSEALNDKEISIGVTSINGQTGAVNLAVIDDATFARVMALVEAYENGELNGNGNITLERME